MTVSDFIAPKQTSNGDNVPLKDVMLLIQPFLLHLHYTTAFVRKVFPCLTYGGKIYLTAYQLVAFVWIRKLVHLPIQQFLWCNPRQCSVRDKYPLVDF